MNYEDSMTFVPNYKTKDGMFLLMLKLDELTYEKPEKGYWVGKDLTKSPKIWAFNTETNSLSMKSVYHNDKVGFYFKGCPRRSFYKNLLYPINELEELK